MKPVCISCQRFYRMKKSGFYFLEGMPTHNGVKPGTSEAGNWQPYKLWAGDRWVCEGCGSEIISGVGFHPIAEHYEVDFKKHVEQLNASQFQVNDC